MGLIRGALNIATYGAVSARSKKQRMASRQLAAVQGKSEAEIKIAGSRNFDWANQSNIRMRQQRELRARQQAGLAGGPAVSHVPSDDTVNYYPVTIPGSGQLHLIYGDMPDAPTLCGRSGAQDVSEARSIDDVTCQVCRAVAGDFGGPPKSPFILTGRCSKCSRPVVWYKQRNKTPVHTATGKFECPADADDEEGTPAAVEPEPDPARTAQAPDPIPHPRGRHGGLAARGRHGDHHRSGATPPPNTDNQQGTGVAAELERLAALHSSGALDDEEFLAAKARIIHGE